MEQGTKYPVKTEITKKLNLDQPEFIHRLKETLAAVNEVGVKAYFQLVRRNDESGVSGTGTVLDGVVFCNGRVAAIWRGGVQSLSLFRSMEEFEAIHVSSHKSNGSVIVWNEEGK